MPDRTLPDTSTIDATRILLFARDVLVAEGMPLADAEVAGDAMVWSELRGKSSFGIARLLGCVERLRAGGTRAMAEPSVVGRSTAMTVLDADAVWGSVAGARAMRQAVASAREHGVGVAIVRNTSSGLAMGYYPTLAIEHGMIGLAVGNAVALQAPWGGAAKRLGNQAYAIGCPAGRHHPLLLDTSTTSVTWAKIHAHESRGEQLPPGLALDEHGEATIDPGAALRGTLMPLGEHRGSGLAIMWEVLTGVLGGGLFAPNVRGPNDDPAQPMGVSLFCLALDPSVSMPFPEFVDRVDALIDTIHDCPPAPGVARIYAPGERGFVEAERRTREGIPIGAELLARLQQLGAEAGVPW
jgi:LDH2 family malate/lactate/ureidoglycolate dehydrogenase